MRASIQGGLWALLLSSTGLAFASVVDENMRALPAQIAVQTDVVRPLNLIDVPVAAMAVTPETSAVIASIAPLRVPPTAPKSALAVVAPALPPSTLAQLEIYFGHADTTALPQAPARFADAQITFASVSAPAAPAGPFVPVIVTQPALPLPERAVVIQSRNTTPAGNLIIRVQATGNSGGGVVTSRLPQIAPPAPEGDSAPAEDVIETPAPEQAPDAGQAPAAPATPDLAPAPGLGGADGNVVAPAPELPSFGDVPVNQINPLNPEGALQSPNDASVNQLAPTEPDAAPGEGDAETADVVDPADLTALQRNAAAFENAENLPVVGIILTDDGAFVNGPFLMFESGLVATIAMNAVAADVELFAEAYREAGMEVAMQVPLPRGATAADVEVNFAAALDTLPQAAMLFVGDDDGLRNNRQAAGQIVDILASEKHGFVTVSSGLGGPLRAAQAAEVPVATVARNLDDAEGDFGAMLRILERVAFEARRGSGAVVSGTLTPEAIAVLQAWSPEGVVVGPVSAVMAPPAVEEEVAEQPVVERSLPQIEADENAPVDASAAPEEEATAETVVTTDEDE